MWRRVLESYKEVPVCAGKKRSVIIKPKKGGKPKRKGLFHMNEVIGL